MNARTVVVFDGECGLCNRFVAWLVRRDRAGEFAFAGSHGAVGRAVIAAAALPADIGESTVVVARPGLPALTHSDAVLAVVSRLGRRWRTVAGIGRVVPRPLREHIYRVVASRRRRLDTEDPSCVLPSPDAVELWRSRLATMEDALRR